MIKEPISATTKKIMIIMSALLAVAISIVSICGLTLKWPYAAETTAWRQQAIAQDIFDMSVVVPVLIAGAVGVYKKNKKVLLWHAGTNLYIVYTFVIYCFAIHFSLLFPVYCLVFGLSFYSLLVVGVNIKNFAPAQFNKNWLRASAVYLVTISVIFYSLWVLDIAHALLVGSTPSGIKTAKLFTNPVHVLDLSIVLPGAIICGVMALKINNTAIVVIPVFLAFFILMAATIAVLSALLTGGLAGHAFAGCMLLVAGIGSLLLFNYLRYLH